MFAKLVFLIVWSFSLQVFGQENDSIISTKESVEESVKLAPCETKKRFEAVKKLFSQMGAKEDEIVVENFNKSEISNIVVKKKGKSDEIVVVGAHYDKTAKGCGAVDNWTGISIIAHLYQTIRQMETEKSYIFVAFDEEERGLLGSRAMVNDIPKENLKLYCAMVNFDSFGFTLPFSLQNASSAKMVRLAKKLADENKMKFVDDPIPNSDSDSSSFKNRGIPAITFNGLGNDWKQVLHTENDQLERINMSSLYLGYRFGLLYLAKLDSTNCSELK